MATTILALLTWTTRDREALIGASGATFLRQFLPHAARRVGAQVLATGVVQNHVHLLLRLGAVVDITNLVQRLKGASARIANRDGVMGATRLRWAKGYDIRSVSLRALLAARAYLARQEDRHPSLAIAVGASHGGPGPDAS
jgi:REP element-mobilizing transposase RayT